MTTQPQFISLSGERFVILPEADYLQMQAAADSTWPAMPRRNPRGNYPAAEALQVSIARNILRRRRALGWTQAELAKRAGLRPETLNRLEKAKHAPTVATVERIERALAKAKATARRRR
jgi:ribosome-binding protein aMBF1 (putative translation factor)